MRIYLDESKRLGKGKIVIGGFLTFHNTKFIEKFIKNQKFKFNIPDNVELKSINKYGKIFVEKSINDNDYERLEILTFGFNFDSYFIESGDGYINLVLNVIIEILDSIKLNKGEKINIFHDIINAKNNIKLEKQVDKILNKRYGIKSNFKINNSKKYLGLQLADLIVGKYKELYFFEDVDRLDFFVFNKDIKNKKI